MKKLLENVAHASESRDPLFNDAQWCRRLYKDTVKKGAGDNDAQRAALQAEEQDRPFSFGFGSELS